MAINTHNKLLYNNSKFENFVEGNCKTSKFFFFGSITQYIQVLFLLLLFFHLSFLMTALNKILRATTYLKLLMIN